MLSVIAKVKWRPIVYFGHTTVIVRLPLTLEIDFTIFHKKNASFQVKRVFHIPIRRLLFSSYSSPRFFKFLEPLPTTASHEFYNIRAQMNVNIRHGV